MSLGVRTWGNSLDEQTVRSIGTYEHDSEVGRRVLSRLPDAVALRDVASPLVPLLVGPVAVASGALRPVRQLLERPAVAVRVGEVHEPPPRLVVHVAHVDASL